MFRRKVMAYGMEQLRKAGQALRNFDDAYSGKIEKFYTDRFEKSKQSGLDIMKTTAGLMLGGAVPSTRRDVVDITPDPNTGKYHPKELRMKAIADAVLPIESAVVKYGLPAAGVTLAGKGIIDLTAAFGTAADEPEPNTLSM